MVLLHGWPGDRQSYRDAVPLLTDRADVVVPDLRGFGESDRHESDPAHAYSAEFHQLGLVEAMIDGRPASVRAYLRHFWSHWSGPSFELPDPELDRLVELYARPGAFTAVRCRR